MFIEVILFNILFAVNYCLAQDGVPCDTPDQQYGLCINIKSCPQLLNLVITGSNDPKVRAFLRSSTCGYEGNYPLVCCPQVLTKSNPEPEPVQNQGSNDNVLRPPKCGVSKGASTKVVGGVPANLGEYPWMVALGYRNTNNPSQPKWLCGGTLITETHILTAGHCVYNRKDLYTARLGDLDLFSETDGAFPETIPLIKAKIHENYSPTTFTNDIAILTLERKPNGATIWPICLPVDEPQRSNTFLRYDLFVAGWGAIYFRGPSSSALQKVSLPVVSNDNCKKAYQNQSIIDDRIMCLGYPSGGKDACQGDSGGPLMYGKATSGSSSLTYYQVGVVSYGFRCAEPGYPGVYTRVTNFLDWILRNLN